MLFSKYSSYKKLLRRTVYALHLLHSHECYRNANRSTIDPTELDGAERHLQYLDQEESLNAERKDLLVDKSVKRISRIVPFSPFIGPDDLIRSADGIKRLVEVDFDVKHPIVLDLRDVFENCSLGTSKLNIIKVLATCGLNSKNFILS